MASSIASESVAGDSTRCSSRIVPSSSITPPAILVPPTSTPQVSVIASSSSGRARAGLVVGPVGTRARRRRRGRSARPRAPARRARASSGTAVASSAGGRLQQRGGGGRQVGADLRAGLAHGVHGAADRAVGALRRCRSRGARRRRGRAGRRGRRARPALGPGHRPLRPRGARRLVAGPAGERAEELGGLLGDAADLLLGVLGRVVGAARSRGPLLVCVPVSSAAGPVPSGT